MRRCCALPAALLCAPRPVVAFLEGIFGPDVQRRGSVL
eukprot:gene16656-34791_t